MALSYGPDLGFQGLREQVARWLGGFYGDGKGKVGGVGGGGGGGKGADRICVSGVSFLCFFFC